MDRLNCQALCTEHVLHRAQHTDVFIGMHGDGWADAMFLRSEAVALHLVPYGWLRAKGTAKPLIRGNFYKTIVVRIAIRAEQHTRIGHPVSRLGAVAAAPWGGITCELR